jgi:hypothetical protein
VAGGGAVVVVVDDGVVVDVVDGGPVVVVVLLGGGEVVVVVAGGGDVVVVVLAGGAGEGLAVGVLLTGADGGNDAGGGAASAPGDPSLGALSVPAATVDWKRSPPSRGELAGEGIWPAGAPGMRWALVTDPSPMRRRASTDPEVPGITAPNHAPAWAPLVGPLAVTGPATRSMAIRAAPVRKTSAATAPVTHPAGPGACCPTGRSSPCKEHSTPDRRKNPLQAGTGRDAPFAVPPPPGAGRRRRQARLP